MSNDKKPVKVLIYYKYFYDKKTNYHINLPIVYNENAKPRGVINECWDKYFNRSYLNKLNNNQKKNIELLISLRDVNNDKLKIEDCNLLKSFFNKLKDICKIKETKNGTLIVCKSMMSRILIMRWLRSYAYNKGRNYLRDSIDYSDKYRKNIYYSLFLMSSYLEKKLPHRLLLPNFVYYNKHVNNDKIQDFKNVLFCHKVFLSKNKKGFLNLILNPNLRNHHQLFKSYYNYTYQLKDDKYVFNKLYFKNDTYESYYSKVNFYQKEIKKTNNFREFEIAFRNYMKYLNQ